MKLVIQRVQEAKVTVEGKTVGSIGKGLLVLLGIHKDDRPEQTVKLVDKLLHLRIFADEQYKMNLSVQDVNGEVLVVSQFTLYGNCSSGRRPDFISSAPGNIALPIYEKFAAEVAQKLGRVQTGEFGAMMQVSLVNDGPVTFILEDS